MSLVRSNLTLIEAIECVQQGLQVRLPEWTGYWFLDPKDGGIKVFTRTGEILDTPHYSNYSTRKDWQAFSVQEHGLGFDFAILALKAGRKVCRLGWNGKDMYLWLLPAAQVQKSWIKDPYLLAVFGDRETLSCLGSIRMKTAKGEVVTGWAPSQEDMMADDWQVYTG